RLDRTAKTGLRLLDPLGQLLELLDLPLLEYRDLHDAILDLNGLDDDGGSFRRRGGSRGLLGELRLEPLNLRAKQFRIFLLGLLDGLGHVLLETIKVDLRQDLGCLPALSDARRLARVVGFLLPDGNLLVDLEPGRRPGDSRARLELRDLLHEIFALVFVTVIDHPRLDRILVLGSRRLVRDHELGLGEASLVESRRSLGYEQDSDPSSGAAATDRLHAIEHDGLVLLGLLRREDVGLVDNEKNRLRVLPVQTIEERGDEPDLIPLGFELGEVQNE